MELKRIPCGRCLALRWLLIVPYGIETNSVLGFSCITVLLIVPYGIETWCKTLQGISFEYLLIVPYGIETDFNHRIIGHIHITFNRTLWN